MPKDVTPPEPKPIYEGITWLGSVWGRTGNPNPAKAGATFGAGATIIIWSIAVKAYATSGWSAWVIGNTIVGAACALATAFYYVEAHFAARVRSEQEPLPKQEATPDEEATEPSGE